MGVLSLIIVGFIAGLLGKFLHPGPDPRGFLKTILIGILGAFVGGFIGEKAFGWNGLSGIDLRTIGIATLGSVLVLILWRVLQKKA